MNTRVAAYVDGFNLYFGLRDSGYRRYMWLDVQALAASLVLPHQAVHQTKYFTALVAAPEDKRLRQSNYLEALTSHCGTPLSVVFGRYQTQMLTCRGCGGSWSVASEKKTDVNIAVEMLVDAFHDRFDTALVISADSDLVPAVEAVHRLFPAKRVVVAFPPGRHSLELRQTSAAAFPIGRAKLASAQMPDVVRKANDVELSRPAQWT